MPGAVDRKRRGAWYTPPELVHLMVDEVVTADFVEQRRRAGVRRVRVLDPACGDGRFLRAAAERIASLGGTSHLIGIDIDGGAIDAARHALGDLDSVIASFELHHHDALAVDDLSTADLVVGNPPFLSQMATATTRGGSSRRGGGPYADAAVEFLALAAEAVAPQGGRVALVLPQSLLAVRDADAVRKIYDDRATLVWSWWTGDRIFDAQVLTCALAFEFGHATADRTGSNWSHVITSRRAVPDLPALVDDQRAGCLGDRARLNANFRDEYYGMIPAVGDHANGPPLITSGLIDPGRSWWGVRPVRFAKRRFERPRIDLDALDGKMPRWARDRLVPKVLIANQTSIIEALADPDGTMLPGVPVVAVYPSETPAGQDLVRATWEIAAVLTSPVASAWAWHRSAGTGLSHDAIRLGPVVLADLPWPAGALDAAVVALVSGDVRSCAAAVHQAYGLGARRGGWDDSALLVWWTAALERIESRQPDVTSHRAANDERP